MTTQRVPLVFRPHPIDWAKKAFTEHSNRGLILPILASLFAALECISPVQLFCGRRRDSQGMRDEYINQRAIRVDSVIMILWLLEALIIIRLTWELEAVWRWVVLALAILRIADLFQVIINSLFFERRAESRHRTSSVERTGLLSVLMFLELALLFAITYTSGHLCFMLGPSQPPQSLSVGQAIYFSLVTQTTLGFGDIAPIGWARASVIIQVCMGILIVALLFGRVVSSLARLEEIKEEDKNNEELVRSSTEAANQTEGGPTAGALYQALTHLVIHAENSSWNRLSAFLIVNSILLVSWSSLLKEGQGLRVVQVGICVFGLVLSLIWVAFGVRSRRYLEYYVSKASALEAGSPESVKPFQQAEAEIPFTVAERFARSQFLIPVLPFLFYAGYALLLLGPMQAISIYFFVVVLTIGLCTTICLCVSLMKKRLLG